MESIKPESTSPDIEKIAEEKLDDILENPENAFLKEHSVNIDRIDAAETATEALQIAEDIILERLKRTYKYEVLTHVEGVKPVLADVEGVKKRIELIKEHHLQIGEGGDAYVVIDKNDIKELPPEVCYKFAKKEETPRGRNALAYEAKLQGDFYDFATQLTTSKISVPEPYYVNEMGADKMFAMEKLPAKSIDDILRGLGSLPDWFDVEQFCSELKTFLDLMHEKGMYHRDMHIGNVMVRQTETEPDDGKWGYVIDFGLSGYGMEGLDPYIKEEAGQSFTYANDYDIIKAVKKLLSDYKRRQMV